MEVMEGSSKTNPAPPGLFVATSGPRLSEELHNQTDSFLTAARLVRRGWTEEGKKTGAQFSDLSGSAAHQSPLHISIRNPGSGRTEICLKVQRSRQVPVVISRETAEDGETHSEQTMDEAKQTSEGALAANTKADRQTGVVRVWKSTCRSRCRQSRKLKAPMLPVIAEM